jgi:hypothetical protein
VLRTLDTRDPVVEVDCGWAGSILSPLPSDVALSVLDEHQRGPFQLAVEEHHGHAAERLRVHYGLGDGDAVLVRPDGYIAWRCDRTAEPGRALRGAVALALGLPQARDEAA